MHQFKRYQLKCDNSIDETDVSYANDGNTSDVSVDEYALSNIDPKIFKDPLLMVKWLEHQAQYEDNHEDQFNFF